MGTFKGRLVLVYPGYPLAGRFGMKGISRILASFIGVPGTLALITNFFITLPYNFDVITAI